MSPYLRIALRSLAATAVLAAATQAHAQTTTGTLAVNGTVVRACTVATTPLNFGTNIPSPLVGNVDATGGITATCSPTVPYTIALGAGAGTGATVAVRRLMNGTNTLNYALYTNAARTTLWGDNSNGTTVVAGIGNGAAQPITVYGRIPTGQAPVPGAYADSVTVTLNF
jgi:spore coat protein U-like protein